MIFLNKKRNRMKKTHRLLLMIFVSLTLTLSACVPGPRVTGAPGLALGEETAFLETRERAHVASLSMTRRGTILRAAS